MLDPIFAFELDYGKLLGREGSFDREHTRSKIIELCAFDYHEMVVKVLELRESEGTLSDITDDVLAEAELLRREYHRGSLEAAE